jgi:hypothetical protein
MFACPLSTARQEWEIRNQMKAAVRSKRFEKYMKTHALLTGMCHENGEKQDM